MNIKGRSKCLLLVLFAVLWCANSPADAVLWEEHVSAGVTAHQRGQYEEALYQFERALKEAEAFGKQDPGYATTLDNLAAIYCDQGRYAEAEPFYQQSLAILEKAAGPEHPDVATSLNHLAELYRAQGRYGTAELLYRRALAIEKKALGSEHPSVATDLNNLALPYEARRRYGETKPLYKNTDL